MLRALAGRPNVPFDTPEGLAFVDIDRDTGKVAAPSCPRVFHESFIAGTEPTEICPVHSF
jgi:membrane carboxypeptidase/penicillin-binding protein